MFLAWRDLRNTCKECGERADFDVEYSNADLPIGYIRDGFRIVGFCRQHLPEEVVESRKYIYDEATRRDEISRAQ